MTNPIKVGLFLGSLIAFCLGATIANSAANEVRIAFFLEWATPNQEDKVKKTFDIQLTPEVNII